jgi:hypothetical protein
MEGRPEKEVVDARPVEGCGALGEWRCTHAGTPIVPASHSEPYTMLALKPTGACA